jgi:hypothetical protein
MKRTGLLIASAFALLTFGCTDEYVPFDYPKRILVFHNTLSTRIAFNLGDSPYATQ